MNERLRYWVWLSQCFSYGSTKPAQLLEAGADPVQLYEQGREYRQSFDVLTTKELSRMEKISLERADFILSECEKHKIWVLTWEDELFPPSLRHIYGPPIVLYGKGNLSGIAETLRLTIVGTRSCSDYAKKVAGNIAYLLAKAGVTVVSGCAVGIDEYAHRGAIKAGGRSIGIMACGVDVNYPADTKQVREHLLYRDGVLLSELPPGANTSAKYFPTRNRLLAGIAEGVFVPQAPRRSGALITAELAIEQGKELFCLPPCDIFDSSYQGVVPYLRDGAVPVYGAEDILSEYAVRWADKINMDALRQPVRPQRKQSPAALVADESTYAPHRSETVTEAVMSKQPEPKESAEPIRLAGIQKELYVLLEELPRPMDEIIRQSGRKPQEVLAALTEMELLGLVRAYPGGQYGKAF